MKLSGSRDGSRCFRLKEPSYDIPRSSHCEYRTLSSDDLERGESLLLTSPAGAGVMPVEAAGSLIAILVPVVALTNWLVGASVEANSPTGALLLKWIHDSVYQNSTCDC